MPGKRYPAVAGRFYAGSKEALESQIEDCFNHNHGPGEVPKVEEGPRKLIGLVSPHAGYPYSGPVAAHGFYHLAKDGKPETVIILGPNHSGMGPRVAIDSSDVWKTPLGDVEINEIIREKILKETESTKLDSSAHMNEHSLEVQLPFLQYLFGNDFTIVPICIMQQNKETSKDLGEAIGEVTEDENVLIIASTDLTHYESPETAESQDWKAIKKMENLDWEGLIELVSRESMSVCGYGPVASTIVAAKRLGASDTETFKYATSGDVAGPSGQVVGYCSLGIYR